MDPMLDFTGKVALITGAASGFGKLLAAELGKRGARLVLGDINMDALDKLVADLEGQGVTALARRCDVSSEADCKAMVDTAVEQFGRLDMAVNNAGIAHGFIPIHELTGELLYHEPFADGLPVGATTANGTWPNPIADQNQSQITVDGRVCWN
ncbi:MAG: SDR family NAD(P)-dependent oxidoreductase, partial [Alcanivorax sp.]|nr:SDR family NAD(P)-dependent oxidoreductase [Alcanivorax sp.]